MRRAALVPSLALSAVVLLAVPSGAQPIEATMALEPADTLGLGQRAVLRLRIEGAGKRVEPEPELRLDNLRLVAGPSTSSSLTIVRGVTRSRVTLSWHLEALALGSARVYDARVRVEGQVFELGERRLRVVAEAPGRRPPGRRPAATDAGGLGRLPLDRAPRPGTTRERFEELIRQRSDPSRSVSPRPTAPRVLLRAEALPADPWVGQQVLYTLYLLTEVNVRSINPEALPEFKGFWSRGIPQPPRIEPQAVTWEGERIYRFVLLEHALFPRRGGRFEIPPVTVSMEASLPEGGSLGSALTPPREIVRTSNPLTVEVRQLPPAPAAFAGAVGDITLGAELVPRQLPVGEAATLTLTVRGRGHLQGLPAPELEPIAGLRIFAPQQQGEESVEGKDIAGHRSWSYVLVAERGGTFPLPSFELPYFDPREARYRTARAPALELVAVADVGGAGDEAALELHPIRGAALPVTGRRALWPLLRPWLFALPWGLAAVLLLVRRRGGGTGSARRRLLAELDAAAGEERPRQAAVRIETAWRDYLDRRWGISPGTASTRWGRLLVAAGAPEASARELVELADDLHYLRYAPKLSSTEGLGRELDRRSRKLARGLG